MTAKHGGIWEAFLGDETVGTGSRSVFSVISPISAMKPIQ